MAFLLRPLTALALKAILEPSLLLALLKLTVGTRVTLDLFVVCSCTILERIKEAQPLAEQLHYQDSALLQLLPSTQPPQYMWV